ncbi:hypothetical protein [Puniceibacterium confluentis]|uniref:hypothetical protein n=1 Tax=Puniceibacterium confluentis TaxID=1958944 RepID=UPI0011B6A59A|nr:hypothetical protein [Puniceibacterium confluentis]
MTDLLPPMRSLSVHLGPRVEALRSVFATRAPAAPRPANSAPQLPSLRIETCDRTPEEHERARYFAQGQFLARQEQWEELSRLIRTFDRHRVTTPGGTPVADVLALGARADAVDAARDAVRRGDVHGAHAPLAALEDIWAEHSGDHGVGLVVALAHIDTGWAWRGEGWTQEVPAARMAAFHSHFRAAAQIIDGFDAFELDAPALAAARCALLAADMRPSLRVADDYEDVIDLDPRSPRHMRSLGNHMLPRWFGSYEQLELQARRTAARTRDIWGAGAYAWVHFDALAVDPGTFRRLDSELFVEGLHDILARRPDQHTVNLLAAHTGLTLARAAAPGSGRARVAGCFDWIVRDHLCEVHPMVWAAALPYAGSAPRGGCAETVARGRARALSTLAEHFAPEIRRNRKISFEADGLHIH